MYDSSVEFQLDRAAEYIKSAHQRCKLLRKESDKKDETIQALTTRIEALEKQERHHQEFRRSHEKENRDLAMENEDLRQELDSEQTEIERLKEEVSSLRKTISLYEERVTFAAAEKEKADHIIKNLLRKIQQRTVTQPKPV